MTEKLVASGWTADWLPAWLAAFGAISRAPGLRLHWTAERVPQAVFTCADQAEQPLALIAGALPTDAEVENLAIAQQLAGCHWDLERKVGREAFAERARVSMQRRDRSLEATLTDLGDDPDNLDHGGFDPPAPQGQTLHQRLVRMRSAIAADPEGWVLDSLSGSGRRVGANGLGFDPRRFASGVLAGPGVWVDPVVETLAFYGTLWFPVRAVRGAVRQRGWRNSTMRRSAFTWPAWSDPLDSWAVDALLDLFYGSDAKRSTRTAARSDPGPHWRRRDLRLLGVHAAYGSVPQEARSQNDVTRAFSSERLA